jgi:hypothetical protein
MAPAEECLDTTTLTAAEVDDRLVPELELAAPQGRLELALA